MINKMKLCKNIVLSFMILSLLVGVVNQFDVTVYAADYGISNPVVSNGVSTWDTIYFGNYYQNSTSKKEPIKWRVLSINGNEAFLLSDKILNRYEITSDEYFSKVTWDISRLRKWLNNDFYNTAFSDNEKNSILNTYVENNGFDWNVYSYEKDDFFKAEGGSNTYDKVFNLSMEEVNNRAYGFVSNDPDDNIFYSDTRYAEGTNYAGEREDNSWWLRTPGANNLPCVINEIAPKWIYFTPGDYYGVRPAIRINLNNSNWTKADSVTLSHDYVEHKKNDYEEQEAKKTEEQSTLTQEGKTTKSSNQNDTKKSLYGNKIVISSTSIKKVKSKKKTLTVTWKKAKGVTGYEIQYSLKKNFKKSKTKKVKKASTTSLTIKKLKRKKKYYVRIRTYKKVKGKTYKSNWSNKTTKKTK